MINHFRTLLRNVDGTVLDSGIGEAYVPPDFKTIILPTSLLKLHRFTFGTAPDAVMRNMRLYQLLRMLSETPLQEFVDAFDSRKTYSLVLEPFFTAVFGETISDLSDPTMNIVSKGELPKESSFGALYYEWRCVLSGGDFVRITQTAPNRNSRDVDLVIINGVAEPFTLPGSLRTYMLSQIPAEATWKVRVLARPKHSLGDLYTLLNSVLSDSDLFEIFRSSPGDLKRTWDTHHDALMRLGAIIVAWVQRVSALRGE